MPTLQADELVQSLAEAAYHELHRLITTGQLDPGRMLAERTLCDKLGMSRTPVRQALHRLVVEGLLEAEPNRGVRVREYSTEDILGLCIVREALEGQAVRYAAPRITDEELDGLRDLCTAMETVPTEDPAEYAFRFRELDVQFHQRIVDLSGVPVLIDHYRRHHIAARQILGWHATRAPLALQAQRARAQASDKNHRLLVEALATRDPARAETELRRQTQDYIARMLDDVNRLHLAEEKFL